ncbi:hypothetical protein ACHAXR_006506 [Thalassiosira sp. AJA248-18]
MKLFDCHCHTHMGPRGISPLLESIPQPSATIGAQHEHAARDHTSASSSFAGAAIMSTHPRDYAAVDSVVAKLRERSYRAVPCYGIHPWFLHEVLNTTSSSDDESKNSFNDDGKEDDWLVDLKQRLIDHPDAIVGEIGLDGARWREVEEDDNATVQSNGSKEEVNIWKRKRVLSCPMDLQRRAFEQQLLLAAELQRPVSIHVVRAWGELLDSFDTAREAMEQKYLIEEEEEEAQKKGEENEQFIRPRSRIKPKRRLLLPPKVYFHAFSGKAGVLPSLLAACKKGNVPREDVFFGFAPAIPNFYSAKTPSIMKQIGIHQLVLETDLEDSSNAWSDLKRGVEGLALALDMDVCEVAEQTYWNADRLYFSC